MSAARHRDSQGGAGPACYGLGLSKLALPDGRTAWGKTGHTPGYASRAFAVVGDGPLFRAIFQPKP